MPMTPLSTSTFHSSVEKRQVVELIDIMSPQTVPFLKLVGINGEPGTNPKLEWLEDTLLAETSTVGSAYTTTQTTLNVATGTGINFQPNSIIKVDSEIFYVSAVSTDALTVVYAVAGTTNANHAQGATVSIIGFANFENSAAPSKGTTDITTPYNYFQDFDTSYQISYKAANTDVYGVPEGDDSRELEKAFKEVVIKLERSSLLGYRATASGSSYPNLLGGLDWFLSQNNTTYTTPPHYEVTNLNADLQEKDVNDALQSLYYAVGEDNMAKTIVTGYWNKRRINDIYAPSARMQRNERVGGVIVDTIDTDVGPVDVVLSLRVPTNTIYFVNLDFVSVHPYQGLAFFDQELSRSGAYIKREIFGSYTTRIANCKSMGVIRGTTTS